MAKNPRHEVVGRTKGNPALGGSFASTVWWTVLAMADKLCFAYLVSSCNEKSLVGLTGTAVTQRHHSFTLVQQGKILIEQDAKAN